MTKFIKFKSFHKTLFLSEEAQTVKVFHLDFL